MKRIFIIAILSCVNIFAWGQTENGKEMLQNAKNEDARSQYLLASYYERAREGFEKDEAKALEWYTKAGEQNYISAIHVLKSVYEFGKLGQAKDSKKVIYWIKKEPKLVITFV